MHWFSRAFVAALTAIIGCIGAVYLCGFLPVNSVNLLALAFILLCSHLITIAIYRGMAEETRCRKCGCILRDISEPMCPE